MTMTPEAKAQLGTTIRAIRQHLVGLPTQPDDGALHAATETAYRLSVRTQDAGLDEAARVRRARLEAWIGEQQRADAGQGSKGGKKPRAAEDYRGEAEKQAAYTLLNRLVLLRLMEAPGPGGAPLRAPAVVTGGWESRAYQDFRQLAPALCKNTRGNESEGYAFLLQLVFEDLATDLPGLYGPAGVAELIPIPAATLRHVVDALNDPALDSCWSDDMTLGWVYQYWNDPEREALDAKLNGGGKVEPHELASKTQMFTERYMVDWLLQNSLNPLWLAICAKNGWTADVSSRTSPPDPLSLTGEGEYGGSGPGFAGERGSVLWGLEERRVAWRAQREEGTVGLTELMPLYSELERRWAYYVPQPIPDEAVAHAPDSVRDLKLLDPAVGSGHFLVVAFDLLLAFYQEEARHRASSPLSQGGEGGRGGEVSLRHAVESILENNLHGLDLDPRAIQIAAAALWLKAKQVAPDARPERLNLVAANLRLASLPDDDPALVELRHKVERQTGIPGALTDTIVHALRGADHLGSLLKIDQAVEAALDQHERRPELQTELFGPPIIEEDEWAFAKPPRFRVVDSPFITPEKLALAKRFRKEPTDAEAKAWALLRNRQIHNLKFRRQQPILGFIVDFYCAEHGIILELDGPIHDSQQDYDQARTEILQSTGMWVLRLRNEDVTPEHLSALLQAFGPHPPQPPLSPEGEGGSTGSPPLRSRRGGAGGGEVPAGAADLYPAIEAFLATHTRGDDLGLRLRGEQLAAGVRFVRLLREGTYHLVVANPPYQGTSKMADSKYIETHYPLGKADLFAAFLLRGLELVKDGGVSAMLTMRNWMFIKQYSGLRECLLQEHSLAALGDVSWGAFREMRDNPVAMSVFARGAMNRSAVAVAPTDPQERVRTQEEFEKKAAGLLAHVGRHDFRAEALKVVPEWPLVYWWGEEMLRAYQSAPLIGEVSPARFGLTTGNNPRFVRRWWEANSEQWSPFLLGAEGREWMIDLRDRLQWRFHGLEVKSKAEAQYGSYTRQVRNEDVYFRLGVGFAMIGSRFAGQVHRMSCIIGNMGSSVFPADLPSAVCAMNSSRARAILASLNPGVHFEVGDVNRLPLFPIASADEIFAQIEAAFTLHESHREPSVEFLHPGPSPWRHAQAWAQLAVDRPDGAPLPDYLEQLDPEPPTDHLSFALGVALGRFKAPGSGSEGVIDPAKDDLSTALPAGLLFLDGTLDAEDFSRDSLGHPAAAPLRAAWGTFAKGSPLSLRGEGGRGGEVRSLRKVLSLDFFGVHKGMYENRPIHWPLSSSNKTFVAWVNIHRMDDQTLRVLQADHLQPALSRLEGELNDLRAAREGADAKAAKAAEARYAKVSKAREELAAFISRVEQCADRGAPVTDPNPKKCPPREQDARYAPDLDDGVMLNSAALWPLLEPQWKDPKKWWAELSKADGRKDYDWSHLAMRYWPRRVDAKCQADPSLGVAHGCFWKYHPERAWAWELRLQDEIGGDFRIEEAPYEPKGLIGSRGFDLNAESPRRGDAEGFLLGSGDEAGDRAHRAVWILEHPVEALAAVEKEAIRRMGRGEKKKLVSELALLESGLWSGHAAEVWELELRLSEKQGAELRIVAPDEGEARAAFELANPGKVKGRAALLKDLVVSGGLFGEEGDEGDDAELEDVEESEEDE